MAIKILKTKLAEATREICEKLYNEGDTQKVYDYCNKIGLKYNSCKPCEVDTPTVSDVDSNTCAICGSNKYL